jgi:ABC-type polar amino acid transport system ATPase subunit
MTGKSSPLNVAVIKEKIEKGQIKVKGRRNASKAKPKQGLTELQREIFETLKRFNGNGNSNVTSTMIRDALGLDKETGRDTVRRVMRKLARLGMVKIGTKQISEKRQRYVYNLA